MYFNFLIIKPRRLVKFSAGREEVISLWSFNVHLSSNHLTGSSEIIPVQDQRRIRLWHFALQHFRSKSEL